jgi:hypothetical protein
MPASEPSHRKGECICIGEEVTSVFKIPLGYWSKRGVPADEIEEMELE